jgi:penicillin-binding protein 1A
LSSVKFEKAQKGCLGLFFAFLLVFGGVGLFGAAALHSFLKSMRKDLPNAASLAHFEPSQTTRIYSGDGKLIATLYRENRTWANLKTISPWMVKAVLAIEDSRFYEHRGVDPIGVARALLASRSGDKQGASTVTMQLARGVFLTQDKTWQRKIKEALLAVDIEKRFTKDEIMELYLNQIYLSSGAYGVHAASNLYFRKPVKSLSPAQAAVLAGIPQYPNAYNPLVHEDACKKRAMEVLDRMKTLHYLSKPQYERAVNELRAMKFHNKDKQEFTVLEVPYFTTYVIKQLYKRFDEDTLYRGGFKIYTTVDLKMQEKAEKIVKQLVSQDAEYLNVHASSLVCVENKTGYIKAMVGGLGWTKKNQFNRAWQARRQPGSSFKPFVYATALECGLSPDSVVPDSPLTVDGWSPKNSDGRFMGGIPLSTALQHSRNVVSVRLAQITGLKRIIDYAHQCGITENLNEFLSLSLGACDVSPLEMAGAYTVFPNAGLKIPTSGIKVIFDADGHVVEDNRVPVAKEVFSEPTASNMVDMMKRVVEAGTATNAYLPNHEVAGKTGTTDSFRDAWFIGYTADYTTAVWVGNDDYSKMWTAFGGDLPARIWHDFMVFALRNKQSSRIVRNRISRVSCLYCNETNERAGPSCPKVHRKLLYRSEVPYQYCGKHGAPAMSPTGYYKGHDDGSHSRGNASSHSGGGQPGPAPREQYDGPGPVPQQVQLPPDVPADVPVNGEQPMVAPPPVDSGPVDPGPAPVPVEVPLEPPPPPAPAPAPAPPPEPAPLPPE